ncbi:MAG: methionyl-tRNA formyltransferase [Eubacteriales bacterium]
MRVVFMGTPDFAIPSLKALLEDDAFDVVAVVTQPDKPRGRSKKLTYCPTKEFALKQGLEVYCFDRIRNKENIETLEKLKPDFMVTAAYGQILSQKVLDIPKMGCVNVHGSLLPKYRGAAPIQWAVINGEKQTGITTMLTERGLDCGDILLKETVDIKEQETAGELFDRLAVLGGEVLIKTLHGLADGSITPKKQNEEEATHFPMLQKQDGEIHWDKTAGQIHNLIRGVNPWPGAYTTYKDMIIKIWSSQVVEGKGECGEIIKAKDELIVACKEGAIKILEMQIPGKKRMAAELVLRGFEIDAKGKFV